MSARASGDVLGGRLSEVETVLAQVRNRALTRSEALDDIAEIVEVRHRDIPDGDRSHSR